MVLRYDISGFSWLCNYRLEHIIFITRCRFGVSAWYFATTSAVLFGRANAAKTVHLITLPLLRILKSITYRIPEEKKRK